MGVAVSLFRRTGRDYFISGIALVPRNSDADFGNVGVATIERPAVEVQDRGDRPVVPNEDVIPYPKDGSATVFSNANAKNF